MAARRGARSIANSPAVPATAPAAAKFHRHELHLPGEASGLRLDQALARALPQYSRARLQDFIAAGAVRLGGRIPRASERVHGGEVVQVEARVEPVAGIEAEPIALDVVYEDRALLVINKPPGLVVHPGAGNPRHTLQNALLALDPELALVPRAGIVHRLDKDTSGLLLIARTLAAHGALVAALAARQIERQYLALCSGVVTGGGSIDRPIGRHRSLRTRMAVRADGRPALTHYRIERRFRAHTLLRVSLATGRTHQIRVHLAHLGFPIVGDPVYGGRRRLPPGCTPALAALLQRFPSQALHAARLALAHPLSGRALHWEAPLPPDMSELIAALAAA